MSRNSTEIIAIQKVVFNFMTDVDILHMQYLDQ